MEDAIQRRVQEILNSEEFETEVNKRMEARKKVLFEIMDAGLEKEHEYALRYERQKLVLPRQLDDFLKSTEPASFTGAQLQEYTSNFRVEVGEGSTCKVYRGTWREIEIAVKMCDQQMFADLAISFKRESSLLSPLVIPPHKNIVKLLGFCNEGQTSSLVFPFYSKGSLQDALTKPAETIVLGWSEVLKIIRGIAAGLDHLHSRRVSYHGTTVIGIIHCDLKPSNVLLDEDDAIICDFGNAVLRGRCHSGTEYYFDVATEDDAQPRSDLFSFGIIVMQLLMKKECPKNLRVTALEERLVHHTLADDNEELRISRGRLIDLALSCTDPHPSRRPKSAQEFIEIFDIISRGL